MALKGYIVEEVALDCADGLLTRREALRRLGLMGLTGAAAATLLAACGDDDEASSTSVSATTSPLSAAPTTSPPPAAATTQAVPSSAPSAVPTSPPPTTAAPAVPAAPPTGEEIRFNGPNGELIGVVAEAASPSGAVLVIHENRGLTEHIRSIPPRLAADGYTALAIDLLSEEGGTAGMPSEGDATAALGNAPTDRMIADLRAGLDELARRAPGAKLSAVA